MEDVIIYVSLDRTRCKGFDLATQAMLYDRVFKKIEYFGLFFDKLLINDVGSHKLQLFDIRYLEEIQCINGTFTLWRDVRDYSRILGKKNTEGDRKTIVFKIGQYIEEVDYNIDSFPDIIFGESCVRISGSLIDCYFRQTKVWQLDIREVAAGEIVTNESYWLTSHHVVVSAGEKIVWVDLKDGKVSYVRHDAKHMMQRQDDKLYILSDLLSPGGFLTIVSMHDASTLLHLSTSNLFAPYVSMYTDPSDNFKCIANGPLLYILHLSQRAITVLDTQQLQIVDHFRIETSAYGLREFQLNSMHLAVLDEDYNLHLFKNIA